MWIIVIIYKLASKRHQEVPPLWGRRVRQELPIVVCFVGIFLDVLWFIGYKILPYCNQNHSCFVVCTQTRCHATLCRHSFPLIICMSWFHLTMKLGDSEPCTLKWLRLFWIQFSRCTVSCSSGVVLVCIWTGQKTLPPLMHWQSKQQLLSVTPFASTRGTSNCAVFAFHIFWFRGKKATDWV